MREEVQEPDEDVPDVQQELDAHAQMVGGSGLIAIDSHMRVVGHEAAEQQDPQVVVGPEQQRRQGIWSHEEVRPEANQLEADQTQQASHKDFPYASHFVGWDVVGSQRGTAEDGRRHGHRHGNGGWRGHGDHPNSRGSSHSQTYESHSVESNPAWGVGRLVDEVSINVLCDVGWLDTLTADQSDERHDESPESKDSGVGVQCCRTERQPGRSQSTHETEACASVRSE